MRIAEILAQAKEILTAYWPAKPVDLSVGKNLDALIEELAAEGYSGKFFPAHDPCKINFCNHAAALNPSRLTKTVYRRGDEPGIEQVPLSDERKGAFCYDLTGSFGAHIFVRRDNDMGSRYAVISGGMVETFTMRQVAKDGTEPLDKYRVGFDLRDYAIVSLITFRQQKLAQAHNREIAANRSSIKIVQASQLNR